jgi:transposase
MKDVPVEQIAYVDETGVDTYLYREYGWSERGKPLFGNVSGRKFKRTGVVAAQLGKSVISPLTYDGTMDSALFEAWFSDCLLPNLPDSSVVVMDNASFHRKSKLFSITEKTGHRLIFLPPYSPEYNPIENFWAWLKRHLRKILPSYSSFDDALCSAFQIC